VPCSLQEGPDELSSLLFLGLLCSRLLRLTLEQRAAHTIIRHLRSKLQWRPGQ
jgi:hypothetical protein